MTVFSYQSGLSIYEYLVRFLIYCKILLKYVFRTVSDQTAIGLLVSKALVRFSLPLLVPSLSGCSGKAEVIVEAAARTLLDCNATLSTDSSPLLCLQL